MKAIGLVAVLIWKSVLIEVQMIMWIFLTEVRLHTCPNGTLYALEDRPVFAKLLKFSQILE